MGEVYRARDTKLDREVAIKVLPDEFAQDEERLARFKREAKVLASLNHPGIAAIYGLEESEGTHYLSLELVPGETLAARLTRGPIPVEEARWIAVQVAEALEEAHERGIVHRDLKPANIMLKPDEKVKVLDFGLAKAFAEETPERDSSISPTLTRDATGVGVILGTAAYMSPEQAKGKQVDKRTDIWAFGAVLYEMLVGSKAFDGDDVSEILASVIKSEPDWSRVRKTTPEPLVKLLRRSLTKDSRQRLRDIGEARLAIEARETEPEISSSRTTTHWKVILPWGLAAVLLLVLGVRFGGQEAATIEHVAHVSIDLPDGTRFSSSERGASGIAISRDGTLLAFTAGRGDASLYLRHLDQEEASLIPDTLGAIRPFFSPDGEWLGFFQNQKLMKVAVEGGPTIELAGTGSVGGTWMPDETIIYNPSFSNGGLWRVSSAGGVPEQLTKPDASAGELSHIHPHLLPDGKHVLVTVYRSPLERAHIDVLSLETGELRVLIEGGMFGRYVSSGHIVYFGRDAVMAQPFDASRLELTGLPLPVVSDVFTSIQDASANFAVSDNGTLVYARTDTVSPDLQVVWVDREGNVSPLTSTPRRYSHPRLSPGGGTMAIEIADEGFSSIWLHELERDLQTRLSFGEVDILPVWTPDNQHVIYASGQNGPYDIAWMTVDGTTPEELILEDPADKDPLSVSPDGATLAYARFSGPRPDVWLFSLASDESPSRLVESAGEPIFSPDGDWLAYESSESGRTEIYVIAFPNADQRHKISTDGGTAPLWAPNGSELFYRDMNKMLAVEIENDAAEGFRPGRPRVLFEQEFEFAHRRNYDISPDGKRFIMVQIPPSTGSGQLEIVFNWFEELKSLVPTEN